jgi:N-carbamoylputrescine amidase
MNELRLSLIQMRSRIGDLEGNLSAACALVDRAAEAKPDLILLPELFSVGPFTFVAEGEQPSVAEEVGGLTVTTFRAKAREHNVAIAVPFFERADPGMGFNTVALVAPDGEILGSYRKTHLATKPARERVSFRPGSQWVVLSYKGWHIGFLFGSEVLHPEAGRALAVLGAELLLIPAALPPHPVWAELHSTRAFENGCYLGVCNLSGDGREGGPPLGGGSLLAEPLGNRVAQLPTEGPGILTEMIRMAEVHRARNQRFMLRDRRPDVYGVLAQAQTPWRGAGRSGAR